MASKFKLSFGDNKFLLSTMQSGHSNTFYECMRTESCLNLYRTALEGRVLIVVVFRLSFPTLKRMWGISLLCRYKGEQKTTRSGVAGILSQEAACDQSHQGSASNG